MGRTLILGIDGLDADFLARNRGDLPSFARASRQSGIQPVCSVFPPDSDSAWATLYTGLSPARHGILHMENSLAKHARLSKTVSPTGGIMGKTFWDSASTAGLRSAIVFPHIGYPAWPIRGLMIGRSSVRDEFSVRGRLTRPDLLRSEHHTMKSLPRRGREGKFLEEALRRVAAEGELFIEILESDEWNLFFGYSSTLDLLEHFFWEPADTSETVDGGEFVRLAHRAYDEVIAKLLRSARRGDKVFIVSDHGHGPRPQNEVRLTTSINAFLRQRSPAATNVMPRRGLPLSLRFLRLLLELTERVDLRNLVHQTLRRFPTLGFFLARLGSPRERGRTSLVFSSPVKSYSYGGIRISPGREQIPSRGVTSAVVAFMRALAGPDGEPLFRWVATRQELDAGPFLDRLPDVLFQLEENYAASDTPSHRLLAPNLSANLVPGTHRRNTATFISSGLEKRDIRPGTLEDVYREIMLSLPLSGPRENTMSPVRPPSLAAALLADDG